MPLSLNDFPLMIPQPTDYFSPVHLSPAPPWWGWLPKEICQEEYQYYDYQYEYQDYVT
jgi:hypothetical protein